jgi:hypothetical protein
MLARPVVAAWTKQTLTDHFFKEAKVWRLHQVAPYAATGMLVHAAATVEQQSCKVCLRRSVVFPCMRTICNITMKTCHVTSSS